MTSNRSKRRRAQRQAAPANSAATPVTPQYADIKVVRELRSGYGSYEAANAVNELLERGWILLGAQFVTNLLAAGEQREFLYVLGSTDPAQAESQPALEEKDFADLEASLRSWEHESSTNP
jgi:hypothetical protein